MTSRLIHTTAIILSMIGTSATASAGDMEHLTVEKVIAAYGGDKFENLKSLTLNNDLRFGWLGQGYTPDYVDLDPMRKIYEFDLVNGFGSEEAWGADGGYAERIFTTAEGQFNIDYNNKTFSHDPEADLYSHFGSEMRTSDTLLAYDLMQHRETAKYLGQKHFRGIAHDLLEFDMPGTTLEPVLWINSETGHISKMRRDVPNLYPYNYVFNDFKKARGITYADDFELYAGTDLIEYAKSRELIPNKIRRGIFAMEKGISAEPETLDAEEMSIDHIVGALHHAGQNGAFSAFWDAGDHIIGVGGYGGLSDRFTAYQEAQGHQKPLKYLIVTHHHSDHLGGAAEALELGAQLVGPETARVNLTDVTEQALTDAQFMALTEDKTSLGPVDIHRISTGHVGEFALAYFPSVKTAFEADHYGAKFKKQASYVTPNAMSIKSEIERLGLEMDYLVTAHSRKAEKWSDFLEMAAKHVPGKCPTGRKICADLK